MSLQALQQAALGLAQGKVTEWLSRQYARRSSAPGPAAASSSRAGSARSRPCSARTSKPCPSTRSMRSPASSTSLQVGAVSFFSSGGASAQTVDARPTAGARAGSRGDLGVADRHHRGRHAARSAREAPHAAERRVGHHARRRLDRARVAARQPRQGRARRRHRPRKRNARAARRRRRRRAAARIGIQAELAESRAQLAEHEQRRDALQARSIACIASHSDSNAQISVAAHEVRADGRARAPHRRRNRGAGARSREPRRRHRRSARTPAGRHRRDGGVRGPRASSWSRSAKSCARTWRSSARRRRPIATARRKSRSRSSRSARRSPRFPRASSGCAISSISCSSGATN